MLEEQQEGTETGESWREKVSHRFGLFNRVEKEDGINH